MLDRRTSYTRGRGGFTLIELLVVIAIIGILAAMLFPVFARARESARKTQCLANVKNIAMAVQIYLTDYDRFPPKHSDEECRQFLDANNQAAGGHARCIGNSGDRFDGSNPYLRWPVVLDEYTKSREIWKCPSVQHISGATWIVPQYTSVWWWYLRDNEGWGPHASNCMCIGPCVRAWPSGWGGSVTDSIGQLASAADDSNRFIQNIAGNSVCLKGRSTSEIDDATQWLVCGDSNSGDPQIHQVFSMAYASTCCWDLSDADAERFNNEPSFRKKYAPHMGGLNLGFADGHAKWWDAEAAVAQAGVCHDDGDYVPIWDIPVGSIKGTCPEYEVIN
jgi:prepilin-type N-terminal cleavage/methylation domain-containing protein/prepilin-type processing-associated H-X9-DG protein